MNSQKNISYENTGPIASVSQTSREGKLHAYFYHFGDDILYVEDNGSDTSEEVLSKEELAFAKAEPEKVLREKVSKWAEDDIDPLARYAWGLSSLADDAVAADYVGYCAIVKRCNYVGGESSFSLVCESPNRYLVFCSAEDAQAWIDANEYELYYLSVNEVANPDYFILVANIERQKTT